MYTHNIRIIYINDSYWYDFFFFTGMIQFFLCDLPDCSFLAIIIRLFYVRILRLNIKDSATILLICKSDAMVI